MKKINVLIFPCGSENAIEIYDALKYSIHVNIFGASSVTDICKVIHPNYVGDIPFIHEETFKENFIAVINQYNIDIIFSTHDSTQYHLASIQDSFNAYLVNGDQYTTKIARSKNLTYELFSDYDWIPRYYKSIFDNINWPVVCKPDTGQGAKGVFVCQNKHELDSAISATTHPVVVEYLPGEEVTVDCFTTRKRELIFVSARTRENIKAGISMRSKKLKADNEILEIANSINERLALRGPWFFQLKKTNKSQWKLLEISTRIAGTMVAQRAWGINLPLLTIQDFLKRDLRLKPNPYINSIERSIKTWCNLEYTFNNVYMDFDDTIILDNKIVPIAISFIYEMINQGKKIFLITRHKDDIDVTLKKYKINKDIFSSILLLNSSQKKSDFISKDSIFIDNHFPERMDVADKLEIPVFDVESLYFLMKQ